MIDYAEVKTILARYGFSKSKVFLNSYEIERDDVILITFVNGDELRGEIKREDDECNLVVAIPFFAQTTQDFETLLRVTSPAWWKTPSEEGLI